MLRNMDADFRAKWEKGKWHEVDFWDKWVREKGGEWPEDFERRLNEQTEILGWVKELIGESAGDTVNILDVGSGPVSVLGNRYSGKDLNLVAIDPLADKYDRIFKENGIAARFPPVKCEGERLLDIVEPESMDFVFSRNALDHSYDPLMALTSMLVAVRPGRYCYVEVYENEGKRANYEGLHQWNFCLSRPRLKFWRRSDKPRISLWNKQVSIDLHGILEGSGEVELSRTEKDGMRFIHLKIRKTKTLDKSYVRSVDEFL